jgi:hypothetical protein
MKATGTIISYSGGVSLVSGDGNWLRELRLVWVNGSRMNERMMFHLQDYYPGGISTPVSLGYTNRDGILFIFKLNEAVEILRRQAR